MKRKWIVGEGAVNQSIDGVSIILQRILAARGLVSAAEIKEFLSLKPQETFDPFLFKDMDQAAELVVETAEKGERICIYGDYDADGVTGISLLLEFLGHISNNLTYYIPSRVDEGYGLNKEAIDLIWKDDVALIITVDCGSTSVSEVAYARELGMSVIITDHHTVGEAPPDCLIINPKQPGSSYPFKDLCGCGVAFKLAQAISRKNGMEKAKLTDLLDLVAIATVGDIVSLHSENRTLVKYGLEVINQGKREGIMRLAEAAAIKAGPLKSYQIAYIIVPHLNAAGRMAEACAGVRLFTAKGKKAIQEAAQTLARNNVDRKRIQDEIYRKCEQIVSEKHASDGFIIIDAGDAHEGITGIVAGKIKETYNRPVIVVTKSGSADLIKGTGRSIDGVNIYELLKEQEALFLKFGGHAGACGFLMEAKNLESLRSNLNKSIEDKYPTGSEVFFNKLMLAASLKLADITPEFMAQIELLEPFGHKNERPFFELPQVRITSVFFMGDEKQHVRFVVTDGQISLECVLFGDAQIYGSELEKDMMVSLAGYPDTNIWNGITKIQFVVKDIKCYIGRVD